jgi:hypothetical protein
MGRQVRTVADGAYFKFICLSTRARLRVHSTQWQCARRGCYRGESGLQVAHSLYSLTEWHWHVLGRESAAGLVKLEA